MRLTITIEDGSAPTVQLPAEDDGRAGRPADVTGALDAGAAHAGGTAGSTPAAGGADDGGRAPGWLVDLLDGLGTPSGAGESAGTDAGTAPIG